MGVNDNAIILNESGVFESFASGLAPTTGRFGQLQRFDGNDFHVKGQRLACQRVVEVDGHLSIIELFDHTWQFSIGRIIEDHQQTRRQLHVLELRARNDLYILRVGLAEGVFRLDAQSTLVASLETEQRRFETWLAIALALVLGGALGNLYDRIALGHVIDFILVHWQNRWYFPAFNFADSAITVGAVMLALDMFKSKKTGEAVHD